MPRCPQCCAVSRTAVPTDTGGATPDPAHRGHSVKQATPSRSKAAVHTRRSSRSAPHASQRTPSGHREVSSRFTALTGCPRSRPRATTRRARRPRGRGRSGRAVRQRRGGRSERRRRGSHAAGRGRAATPGSRVRGMGERVLRGSGTGRPSWGLIKGPAGVAIAVSGPPTSWRDEVGRSAGGPRQLQSAASPQNRRTAPTTANIHRQCLRSSEAISGLNPQVARSGARLPRTCASCPVPPSTPSPSSTGGHGPKTGSPPAGHPAHPPSRPTPTSGGSRSSPGNRRWSRIRWDQTTCSLLVRGFRSVVVDGP